MSIYFGLPEIFEDQTSGSMRTLYNDIKYTLKVPIVNFIFRSLAWYDHFLSIAWNQVKLSMLTEFTEKKASDLRFPTLNLDIPKIDWHQYYCQEEINLIKSIINTFNYVNPKLLIIASAWSESLSNRPILGEDTIVNLIPPGIKPEFPPIKLVDMNNAPPKIYSLLKDIINTHQTFDAASDFRCLANFPDFLGISWYSLKPFVTSSDYKILSDKIKQTSIEIARELPFPITINPKFLSNIYSPKDIVGICATVSLFQNFLPGLIIDIAYFHQIINI